MMTTGSTLGASTHARKPETVTDVAVVGTGIAGLAMAVGLMRRGVNVTLLGPKNPLPPLAPDQFDPRVYALSPASRRLLETLGVWAHLPADRVTPVSVMDVRGDQHQPGGRFGQLEMSAWQAGAESLAWILESRELERALQQAAIWGGLRWVEQRLAATHLDEDVRVLRTEGGQRIHARLAIGADGGQSWLRQSAGVPVTRSDYQSIGVVGHFTTSLAHQERAVQWFTDEGIIALLPMPDTASGPTVSLVWSMPTAAASALLSLPETERGQALLQRLQPWVAEVYPELGVQGEVHGFPLVLQQAESMIGARLALVGDAAHVIHPLAGQGLNLGLGDVQTLLDLLADRPAQTDAGDPRLLRRYQRQRAETVLSMKWATDGLHQLFASSLPPVRWARNAGMTLVNRIPFLKRALIKEAAGQ